MTTQAALPFKFRVKWLRLNGSAESIHVDFNDVTDALIAISVEYDLNSRLYELMLNGYMYNADQSEMVMLTGIYPGGTESMLCTPLISAQMGAPRGPLVEFIDKRIVNRDAV